MSIFEQTDSFEQLAITNSERYATLHSNITRVMQDVNETVRESWIKWTVERLADKLRWREEHGYGETMDRKLADEYRREAKRLLEYADEVERREQGWGSDGFSEYAGASLAAFYLNAESLCFEYPYMVDAFQQESLGQKKILRDINGLLNNFGWEHVGRTLHL